MTKAAHQPTTSSSIWLRGGILAAALFVALFVAGSPALTETADDDSPDQIFVDQVNVELVNIDVYVRDKDGNPVHGLTPDDFELEVDGSPARISNFYSVEEANPVIRSDRPEWVGAKRRAKAERKKETPTQPVEPQDPITTADRGDDGEPEEPPEDQKLLVVVYIDNYNLTPFSRNKVLRELRQFLREDVGPHDRVMMATYDRELHLRQPFTNRPEDVNRALLEIEDYSGNRVHQYNDRVSVLKKAEDSDSFGQAWMVAEEYAMKTRNDMHFTLDALRGLIDQLSASSGRKALVYVSDGLPMINAEDVFQQVKLAWPDDMNMTRIFEFDNSRRFEELAAQANANRVSFYTVDARGLTVFSNATVDYDIKGQAGERAMVDSTWSTNLKAPIQMLAERTGGRAIINTNRFLPDLRRIGTDFRNFYSLGYTPPIAGDGRYHRIKVRLKKQMKGWEVRYREGYRDKTIDTQMHDGTISALHLKLGDNALNADLIFGRPAPRQDGLFDVPFRVVIPFDQIAMIPQGGQYRGRLRFWLAAVDEKDLRSDVQQLQLKLDIPENRFTETEGRSYSYPISLTMEPGFHHVAIGIRDDLGASKAFVSRGVNVGG